MSFRNFGALIVFGAMLVAGSAQAQYAGSQVISGGVGEGGIAAMEQVQNNYTFKAVFSGNGGIFLSNVNASVLDSSGSEVVNLTTDGPILLANLAPGRYTLVADIGNTQKRVKFTVGNRGLRTVNLRLPVSDNSYTAAQPDMGRYANGRAVKGAEPYYDPDFQARGYYPNETATVTTTTTARTYYPNSYYETHSDWDAQQRGYDSGRYIPIDSAARDEYAPPGMAVEGTHAARGHDQMEP